MIDRYITTLTAQGVFFWMLMLAGPGKVSFIVTHINEVDNMRVDRCGELRMNGSRQGVEAKERPWMDWERR